VNQPQPGLNALYHQLHYEFSDQELLRRALTHRSRASLHNERLEFLGDSILGFVAAEFLYTQFENIPEGTLTRLRAKLVRRETLAEVARDLQLGDHLLLGSGEAKSGGHERDSILADALEAVIGAIYIDGGLSAARDFTLSVFKQHLDQLNPVKLDKDAKTQLQEHLQQMGYQIPHYKILDVTGPSHEQRFIVQCTVENLEQAFEGEGTSRRKAEQTAAEKALNALTATQ
jgi:ribonuclease-3